MKQINIKIILLMLVLSNNIIFAQYEGTELSPYQIRTLKHLEELNDSICTYDKEIPLTSFYTYPYTNSKYFKLMNDITDSVRCVIGDLGKIYGTGFNCFYRSNFDGQGHKITLAIVSDCS